MPLHMPRWDLLDQQEQMPVINLPLNQPLWVRGGPGTGKTVLALYRAAQLIASAPNYNLRVCLITYNKSLQIYISEAIRTTEIDNLEARTWHSWLASLYWKVFKSKIPSHKPFDYKWEEIVKPLLDHFVKAGPPWDHIFLDEAQDFPAEVLTVIRAAAKNVTVFSDPNQRIYDNVVDHDRIGEYLGVSSGVYFLSRNYRNTTQILDVANALQMDRIEDVRTATRNGRLPVLATATSNVEAMNYMVNYIENNAELSIGILTHSRPMASEMAEYFRDTEVASRVQIYERGNTDFDPGVPGAKILTFATAKGLEFDSVLIPLVQEGYDRQERDSLDKNQAYVAATRARNDLVFLTTARACSYIVDILLENEDLVESIQISPDDFALLDEGMPF